MYKAELSLILFKIVGIWRPINKTLFMAVTVYNLFTVLAIFLVYSFDISLCMYLILYALNDIDEFAESLGWFLGAFVICVKMTNVLLRRDDIIDLIQILNKDCFQPYDIIEKVIEEKYDFTARRNTKIFLTICITTVTAVSLGGLVREKEFGLPLKAWFPYNYNSRSIFWITYLSQCLSLYCEGFITIASETFVMAMMIQICSQLDVIYHRLQCLPDLYRGHEKSSIFLEVEEDKIIRDCILHHNYVYNVIFAIQFFASILNICTLVYSLSIKNEINDKVIVQSIVLTNSLFQIFLYCWFGNEVILKSLKVAEVVNVMDWTMISNKTKHGLLLISIRARKPIIIKGGLMIPMSLDTFIIILRTSYAAYNLLQNSNA